MAGWGRLGARGGNVCGAVKSARALAEPVCAARTWGLGGSALGLRGEGKGVGGWGGVTEP